MQRLKPLRPAPEPRATRADHGALGAAAAPPPISPDPFSDGQTRANPASGSTRRRCCRISSARAFGALTAATGTLLLVRGQPDYVARFAPAWAPVAGGMLVLIAAGRDRLGKAVCCVAALLLLLPTAAALAFHLLRALGAIPYPVDLPATIVSLSASATLIAAWRRWRPLRTPQGGPLQTPMPIALLGMATALIYPVIKTYWIAGGEWLAPAGAHHADSAYLVPVALVALGTAATGGALRWWHRDAPRWAHPAATAGGLSLIGLGMGGLHAVLSHPPAEGPLLGVLIYGGWLLWGVATLAVAARLSHRRSDTCARTLAAGEPGS